MGMDSLNKAAMAAGYAMAAPDEDTLIEPREMRRQAQLGTALAIVTPQIQAAGPSQSMRAAVASAANWVKGVVPTFGGRAPA